MKFEWDVRKSATNRRKHGVSFEEAETVYGNELTFVGPDIEHGDEEDRERAVGHSEKGRLLVVISTLREAVVRIISARRATRREAEDYEKEIKKSFRGR